MAVMAAWGVMILLATYPLMLGEGDLGMMEMQDAHGLLRVSERASGRLQVTNNRFELIYHLGAYSTDYVQQMQGHLSAHFKLNVTSAPG